MNKPLDKPTMTHEERVKSLIERGFEPEEAEYYALTIECGGESQETLEDGTVLVRTY